MRLFYIIIFFIFSLNFAGFAAQEKRIDVQSKIPKISFVSGKDRLKLNTNLNQDNERLQKDFINNTIVKTVCNAFIALIFFIFLFSKNNLVSTNAIIKRLKYNYWCLFKIRYPKHFFW
ncbi:hypothetical protein EZ449_10570 [Pedobacter frigidisoli]|uniref:Uncharacterized protein n=1 Tax=Pedobacter frigidisoli TaxID=2530455 RepID=A0A4R0P0P4_9SPHI|nr:hypothetical protein [Pedobacter frigidisoli]TCD10257.1 hypothetical protein EZ449_10570 [Pedobacter frigidisoli]